MSQLPGRAVHGGAFFEAIGEGFDDLWRRRDVVSADVLDAWYDPAPSVIETIQEHLPFLIKTSPPTHGEGLIAAISEARRIPEDCILLGSGTSSLMYEVLPTLLRPGSRCVLLDPTYGEYTHLFEKVLGLEVVRVPLDPDSGFQPEFEGIAAAAQGAAIVVLVNPNSPTGAVLGKDAMKSLLAALPDDVLVWVDETYIDFAPGVPTLESQASINPRLIVAKSMSKYYALSGLRVGYLVCHPELAGILSGHTPPWPVGLVGQVAAVAALKEAGYYQEMAKLTAQFRDELVSGLSGMPGVTVYPSVANFLLCRLEGVSSQVFVRRAREEGVFLRDCSSLSPSFGSGYVRTAVKDPQTNERILSAIENALAEG